MLPPPDISARYVEEQSGRPSKDFYNWIKSLSTGASGLPFINVKDYGAKGSGSGDDRAAIQAAVDAAGALGGQLVFFPAGNYAISDFISEPYSDVHLLGAGKGTTTVTLTQASTAAIFTFFGGSVNCGISNLTIDAGNFTTPGFFQAIFAQGITSGFYVRNVEIIGMGKFGIMVQGCANFDLSDNDITLATAINTQNNGINCTQSLQNSNGTVARNVLTNTNMQIDGQYLTIEDNRVSNWKYGGGIVQGPSALTHDNIIRGNICHGSTGVDADTTYPAGLEMFSARNVIANNICFNNSGNGIIFGGPRSIVTGNICYDNGQSAHGGDQAGIYVQDGGFVKADDSIVVGNDCFNQNGITQEYGIQANPTVTGLVFWPNKLVGNNTAAHNVVQTVATLPSASASGVGARAFVTNATVTTFATVVAGGGGNAVPVVSDGTNWRIG